MAQVLLVEDELSLRELYEEVLKDAGYSVDHASDGEEAVVKINKGDWGVLILDIMLPRLDGLEILKKIKATPSLREKPIIVYSNLDNADIMQQCKDAGVSSYLVKSDIDPSTFIDEVQKYLPSA